MTLPRNGNSLPSFVESLLTEAAPVIPLRAPMNRVTTVELPPDVKHHATTAFADSWEAYDALKVDDGWEVQQIGDEEWKVADIRAHRIVVHPPHEPRVCPACRGEGRANPGYPNPQTEIDCALCRGEGEI